MRDVLRWLPTRQRIEYRMAALVWPCFLDLAPPICGLTLSARSSRSHRSTEQALLRASFACTSATQKRVLSRPQFGMTLQLEMTPQFGMANSSLNLRWFYLVVLGLG